MHSGALRAIIAIPARNEAARLRSCLQALAAQMVEPRNFGVLVFANDCDDATAQIAHAFAARSPYRLTVVEATLPPDLAHAGGARRAAMNAAASMLDDPRAALLSTDADGRAASDWLAANLAALAAGADAVAGAFEPDPAEVARLPPALRTRQEGEAAYAALLDEMAWLIDPDPHDPWPRHGIHSGASLAITLGAYRRIGGLPAVPTGEDRALFEAVRRAGLRVRHCPAARVTVSCRLIGRAAGGMADTLLRRRLDTAAPTDPRLERAADAFRRFRCRRLFRRVQAGAARFGDAPLLSFVLRLPSGAVARAARAREFWRGWETLEAASPALARRALPASALGREARAARRILSVLRAASVVRSGAALLMPRLRPGAGPDGSARTAPAG